jgi:hypothetical protein
VTSVRLHGDAPVTRSTAREARHVSSGFATTVNGKPLGDGQPVETSGMGDAHCCKVARIADEYDLRAPSRFDGDHDAYLVARWTGTDRLEPTGVRPLTDWVNKRVVRTVYRRHDRSDTDVRVDAEYEALVGDDVPAHERADVVADLEADGIDPESLVGDCIGKSTLDRHLKDCLDASKSDPDEASDGDWETDGVAYARSSFQTRVESALASLDDKARLPGAGDAVLETPVLLACPHCPTRVDLDTALDRGYVCADHLGAASGHDAGPDATE